MCARHTSATTVAWVASARDLVHELYFAAKKLHELRTCLTAAYVKILFFVVDR